MTDKQKLQMIHLRNEGCGYPNENTVPMDAASEVVSKAVTAVSEEQFRAERLYLMSRSVAKSMLQKGVISEKEFEDIDTILLEKYRPTMGTLLAGKPLI